MFSSIFISHNSLLLCYCIPDRVPYTFILQLFGLAVCQMCGLHATLHPLANGLQLLFTLLLTLFCFSLSV